MPGLGRDGIYKLNEERHIDGGRKMNGALAILLRRQCSYTLGRTQCGSGDCHIIGSETWVLQKKNERKVNAVQMRILWKYAKSDNYRKYANLQYLDKDMFCISGIVSKY